MRIETSSFSCNFFYCPCTLELHFNNFHFFLIIYDFAWKNFRVLLFWNFERHKLKRKRAENAKNAKVSALNVDERFLQRQFPRENYDQLCIGQYTLQTSSYLGFHFLGIFLSSVNNMLGMVDFLQRQFPRENYDHLCIVQDTLQMSSWRGFHFFGHVSNKCQQHAWNGWQRIRYILPYYPAFTCRKLRRHTLDLFNQIILFILKTCENSRKFTILLSF